MKAKVSKSQALQYLNCFSLGYCEIENEIGALEPDYYTSGIYGWNADIYKLQDSNVAIVTGYRPFGSCQISREAKSEILNAWKESVKRAKKSLNWSVELQRVYLNMLMSKLFEQWQKEGCRR